MTHKQIQPDFSWSQIDTILLDMDGTLLDKYFDDHFWEEYVPKIFAETNKLSEEEARKVLLQRYQKVEDTLQWCDLDYWTKQLGLDVITSYSIHYTKLYESPMGPLRLVWGYNLDPENDEDTSVWDFSVGGSF